MIREPWRIPTNCDECDVDTQLTLGLCHECRVIMGYEQEESE